MSEFIDIFVKFSNFVSGVGLLTPCFVPRGGDFLLLSSRVAGGGIVLDETDTSINYLKTKVIEDVFL